jgi:hypothetical protein
MALNDIIDETDRNRLERVQALRERIITELTEVDIPEDPKDRALLIEAMNGLDKSIYSKAKVRVADKTGDDNKDAARIIADVLARHMAGSSVPRTTTPTLDPSITLTNPVDGETSLGMEPLDYNTLLS